MKTVAILVCIAALSAGVMAQTASVQSWTKAVSEKGGVSFTLRSDFLALHEKDSDRVTLYDITDSYSIIISVNEGSGKDWLDGVRRSVQLMPEQGDKVVTWKAGEFDIDMHTMHGKRSTLTIYAASSKCSLTIVTSSKTSADPVVMAFLMSVKLGDKPFFKESTTPAPKADREVSIRSLATSPIIDEALGHKQIEKIEVENGGFFNDRELDDDTVYSRPLLIVRKPRPAYPDTARASGREGSVTVRVIFKANGDLSSITVFGGLKGGLGEATVDAVKKMKFVPAQIAGKNVDVTRTVIYSFSFFIY